MSYYDKSYYMIWYYIMSYYIMSYYIILVGGHMPPQILFGKMHFAPKPLKGHIGKKFN